MNTRRIDLLFALTTACFAGGCALEPDSVVDDESYDALTSNALTSNALTAEALDDPQQGFRAAQVVRYSARCMLTADQTVTVTYRTHDGVLETRTFPGNLGLEPGWIDGALSAGGRRWWAACLGAHINAFGVPVSISTRGPHPALTLTAEEADDYTLREGAFWASYDPDADTALHIYSCYDPANSAAAYQRNRICANESCGSMMTVVGPCLGEAGACDSAHAPDPTVGDYFESCHRGASAPALAEVVTTNLRL